MHEAIGQRPSVRPVSLFSSGPHNVRRPQSPSREVVEEAGSFTEAEETDSAETSDMQAPEQTESAAGVGMKKRKRSQDSFDFMKDYCERQESRQRDEAERESVWVERSQQQMDRMLDLFGQLVKNMTDK